MHNPNRPHLTPAALAERWGMSVASLANMRCQGRGPDYIKIGSRVLYPLTVIEAVEEAALVKAVSA